MQLTFLGATETVTGSKYLLTANQRKILIDCGLFQGYKELRQRNWAKLPVDPHSIDAVVLTHAHIDHSGYIPLLIKNGFAGKVYCTSATRDLCQILLPDSGYLQEEEARFANKHGYSKHTPALPLYTMADAEQSLHQFQSCGFNKPYKLYDDLIVQFNHAGHILGASTVSLKQGGTSILFSGDLGRPHDLVMKPPANIQSTDYLVLESTYGDRRHEAVDPITILGEVINRTFKRGGTLIIPAFAVGRAQSILYIIQQLRSDNRIPAIPVFLDSPMAVNATELFCRYGLEHRLSPEDCREMSALVQYVNTQEKSKQLDVDFTPKIIVSASGMAEGGRVLHHIKAYAPNRSNTILFTGFQASGTRGDKLVRGLREIKILGEVVSVNAEVMMLTNLSAHADYEEILQWLKHFKTPPRKTFITHGEPNAALALKRNIEKTLGWTCVIPKYLQQENL